MSAPDKAAAKSARRDQRNSRALVAAYCEGLELTAVALIRGPTGLRVTAMSRDSPVAADAPVEARWWCRRATEAANVAAVANARLRRRSPGENSPTTPNSMDHPRGGETETPPGVETITQAARKLHIVLQTEQEIIGEAMTAVARVDEEIEKLQRSGGLKSINKSYRAYRIEASARGERIIRYSEWMSKYRANLVRELAAMLR